MPRLAGRHKQAHHGGRLAQKFTKRFAAQGVKPMGIFNDQAPRGIAAKRTQRGNQLTADDRRVSRLAVTSRMVDLGNQIDKA